MTELKKIAWNAKYQIGVPRIDFEHQIFADLINGLADKIAEGKDGIAISRSVREIIKYADFHFVSEENIMEECGYPGYKDHSQLHRALQHSLTDKAMAIAAGKGTPTDLQNFLVDWFLSHTQQEDTRIALYCQPQ